MSEYTLYILSCENGFLYTGIAVNVEKRFELHQKGKGAKFTQKNKPIKIIYTEKFKNRSTALKREAEIKKMDRKQKDDIIKKSFKHVNI